MYTAKEKNTRRIRNGHRTITENGPALNPKIVGKVKVGIPKKEGIMIGVTGTSLRTGGDGHVLGRDIVRQGFQGLKIISPPGVRAPDPDPADRIENRFQGWRILNLQIINILDVLDLDIEIADTLGDRNLDKVVVLVFDPEGCGDSELGRVSIYF